MYNHPLPFFEWRGSSTQASEKDNKEISQIEYNCHRDWDISLKEIKKRSRGSFFDLSIFQDITEDRNSLPSLPPSSLFLSASIGCCCCCLSIFPRFLVGRDDTDWGHLSSPTALNTRNLNSRNFAFLFRVISGRLLVDVDIPCTPFYAINKAQVF